VNEGQVHRFRLSDGRDVVDTVDQPVAAAKPRAGGGLVLSLRDGAAVMDMDGAIRWLAQWSGEGVRGNDVGIDPVGRLWLGTIAGESSPGWLAHIPPQGSPRVVATDVQISNGIGWSPDATRMYYVDSPTKRIDAFDYDLDEGRAVGRREFVDTSDVAGVPDGICVDIEGGVWVAFFRGGVVCRYTPQGRLDRCITFPVSLTTACCFGGADLTDLFVTTARRREDEHEPTAGHLFVVSGVAQGPSPTAFAA
jgi:sugar lactone lactonase YvrE